MRAAKKHQELLLQEEFVGSVSKGSSAQPSLATQCYHCSADEGELIRCGGCKTVKFCGAACATAACKGHQLWCAKLAALQQGICMLLSKAFLLLVAGSLLAIARSLLMSIGASSWLRCRKGFSRLVFSKKDVMLRSCLGDATFQHADNRK